MSVPDDKYDDAAGSIASSYDVAGRAVQMGYVDKEPFIDDYGPSILRSWYYLEPFVLERREEMRQGRYWDNFEKLADEVLAWYENHDLHVAEGGSNA